MRRKAVSTGFRKARWAAASVLACTAMQVTACTMTLHESLPSDDPLPEATVPLTVGETRATTRPFGLGLFESELIFFGKIRYVDDIQVNRPNGMLVPGKRNCVGMTIHFREKEDQPFPTYDLFYTIFPIHPREGDVVTLQIHVPDGSKYITPDLRITVSDQHGNIFYEAENIAGGRVRRTYQPEVTEADRRTCVRWLESKLVDDD